MILTAGLQVRVGASSLALGGLLKHLAVCEDYMFTVELSGAPIGAPWETADWDGDNDWEITSAADDTPQQLYDQWDGAVERSRARPNTALADGGLDQPVHLTQPRRPPGQPAPTGLRPDRGVRQAHRPRRPCTRNDRRASRCGPSPRMAPESRPLSRRWLTSGPQRLTASPRRSS